jgi:hypothetical protein
LRPVMFTQDVIIIIIIVIIIINMNMVGICDCKAQ